MTDSNAVEERARQIKLLLMDCDGVLTDGRIWIIDENEDQKAFHIRDGLGLELWHRAGLRSGIISGRSSTAVARRAKGLNISIVHLGQNDKLKAFEETLLETGVLNDEVAFIGDDLNDIPLMLRCGLAIAVSDASSETKASAQYVTQARGGNGAVREAIELILKVQNKWEGLIADYLKL
jgi:3-deoxy-D-manno-octulosonate 8-phosphate phosphatase (KDO 8-P phosphatase)